MTSEYSQMARNVRRDIEVTDEEEDDVGERTRLRYPLARILTILMMRLSPAATALVSSRSRKARMLSKYVFSLPTNVRNEGIRLRSAEVIHVHRNFSAAPL